MQAGSRDTFEQDFEQENEYDIYYHGMTSGPFQLSDLALLYLEKQLPDSTRIFDTTRRAWTLMLEFAPFQDQLSARTQVASLLSQPHRRAPQVENGTP